jgi:hypothetical protein
MYHYLLNCFATLHELRMNNCEECRRKHPMSILRLPSLQGLRKITINLSITSPVPSFERDTFLLRAKGTVVLLS